MGAEVRESVERMFDASNDWRWNDFVAAYAEEAVISYPQSGEEIEGRDQILGMVEALPTAPRFSVESIHQGVGPDAPSRLPDTVAPWAVARRLREDLVIRAGRASTGARRRSGP